MPLIEDGVTLNHSLLPSLLRNCGIIPQQAAGQKEGKPYQLIKRLFQSAYPGPVLAGFPAHPLFETFDHLRPVVHAIEAFERIDAQVEQLIRRL